VNDERRGSRPAASLDGGGLIQEAWSSYDFLDLAVQLGAVAPDALQKLLVG